MVQFSILKPPIDETTHMGPEIYTEFERLNFTNFSGTTIYKFQNSMQYTWFAYGKQKCKYLCPFLQKEGPSKCNVNTYLSPCCRRSIKVH
jgi:hypothetical protein